MSYRSLSADNTMHRPSSDLTEPARNLEESNSPPSNGIDEMDLDLTMPPDEDEMRENDRRIFTPPPHLAARFYRPSQARRKDSAASSRRNSISSANSRRSSIHQGNDGSEQNKYLAQHIRRASFLEDRLARLADRAAHAEKVRLRAALAKATPRGGPTSEERALAAQQARERNLAEIVANCAEEVKKAKQIAELTKEKREQEIARMKAQMDERMAEAERRREELRTRTASRRSRTHSTAARKPVEPLSLTAETNKRPPTQAEAVRRLQDWWRMCLRRNAVQKFNRLGLSVDGIRDSSFDAVTELLNQEDVLLLTAQVLRIGGMQEGEPGSVDEMAGVRTMLSAFLILGHPHQVLSNKNGQVDDESDGTMESHRLLAADLENPQLQDLVGKTKDLLVTFENIISSLSDTNRYTMPPKMKSTLSEAYAVFHNAFIAWKSRDSNALVEVMLMQFVELDAILQSVKDSTDDAATALYRQSIKDNQLMLIVRIKRLAGQDKGKKMIFQAVAEARKKARKAKAEAGDTMPRIAEHTPAEGPSSARIMSPSKTSMPQTMTPPTTPASKDQARVTPMKVGLQGFIDDNRTVTHELAINHEYMIPVEKYRQESNAILQPLYANMRVELERNDRQASFGSFLMVFRHIRERLLRLLKNGNSMHSTVSEILDVELAERQFRQGSFSYEDFFRKIGALLTKLCAPIRDDEVKDLVQNKLKESDLILRVEALNSFIDTMLCDYVNYMLHVVAPQLIEAAPQYEAKKFTEELEDGTISLRTAEKAWGEARDKVMTEVRKRDPEGINHPKSRPTAAKIYAQMLVDTFTQHAPVDEASVPEMLRLDMRRINQVSRQMQAMVIVGAILLQCKNLLKRDVRVPWKKEALRIMHLLQSSHANADKDVLVEGIMTALESGRSMPSASKAHLRALTRKILSAGQEMMQQRIEPTEPVMRLLLTRLRSNFLARLSPGTASEKVKTATATGEKLAGLGLSEFVDNVRDMCNLMSKVGSVDREAHGPWWDAVATKAEGNAAN